MNEYVGPHVMRSPLTGNYYFVRKAKILSRDADGTGALQVVGQKVDVTESVTRIVADAVKQARKEKR